MDSDIQKLMRQKERIEAEIKELNDVLESQGGVGMKGDLLDAEQYPRSDIDVYSVRHSRHRIICLQNDHKALMKDIENKLHEIHAEARQKKIDTAGGDDPMSSSDRVSEKPEPFARVDRVDDGSPAQHAGLKIGDLITEFGSITIKNFQTLQNIGNVVKHSVGSPLSLGVVRNESAMRLSLTPQTWQGKGLLGCNIVPTKK